MATHRWNHALSASKRGLGAAWRKLRLRILQRDEYLCQPCKRAGRVKEANEVGHIKPRSKGGSDDPENLEAQCHACNMRQNIIDHGHAPREVTGIDGYPVHYKND